MRTPLALFALAFLALLPTTAPAATTLGQTGSGGGTCAANSARAQVASAAPRYTADTAGVITQLRTEDVEVDGLALNVFRPRGGSSYAVLASVPVEAADGVVAVPVRIGVLPGDVLGLSVGADSNTNCTVPAGSGSADVVAFRDTGAAPASGDVTLDQTGGGRLNVAATLEPDADGDGFGDETQDRCPGDGSRTTQDCTADLSISQTPVETTLERDDVNVLVLVVRNGGPSTARDVRVVEAIPSGLQLVAATPSSGGCAGGGTLDCTLPSLAPGATGTVLAVVRAVVRGRRDLEATVSSATPDSNPANNTAGVSFEVEERRTTISPGAFCRVPRLTGLSRTAARRALEAAGCRLGRVRRAGRSRLRMRVRRQTIPSGTRVLVRTRVGITLRSARSRR
jgi:uncharacterized repeat protein (TIGR01451 family)